MEQLFDMGGKKQALQLCHSHVFGTGDPFLACRGTTVASEGLRHLPLRTWVEESQHIAFLQAYGPAISVLTGRNADLYFNHGTGLLNMELQGRLAGVIYEDKVAV